MSFGGRNVHEAVTRTYRSCISTLEKLSTKELLQGYIPDACVQSDRFGSDLSSVGAASLSETVSH